ncbi:hypothetical protein, partial [Burkholderia glumae]|uniref:hypothetical protein n=1 Tax=Burkholderia glumae TaxID=337 RepID=UPI001E30C0AE
ALQTSVLLVHAHLSTLIEHGHVASVNQPRRAMASFKERLRYIAREVYYVIQQCHLKIAQTQITP